DPFRRPRWARAASLRGWIRHIYVPGNELPWSGGGRTQHAKGKGDCKPLLNHRQHSSAEGVRDVAHGIIPDRLRARNNGQVIFTCFVAVASSHSARNNPVNLPLAPIYFLRSTRRETAQPPTRRFTNNWISRPSTTPSAFMSAFAI